MKVSAAGPPPGLWVVRDLQLLHKAWREPGEVARTLQSQNNSPPRPSPFSSRKKNYSPREQVGAARKMVITAGNPPHLSLGDSQLPPPPWTLLCPQVGERCLEQCGGGQGDNVQEGLPLGTGGLVLLGPFSQMRKGQQWPGSGSRSVGGFWPVLEESQHLGSTFRVCIWGIPEGRQGWSNKDTETQKAPVLRGRLSFQPMSQKAELGLS